METRIEVFRPACLRFPVGETEGNDGGYFMKFHSLLLDIDPA